MKVQKSILLALLGCVGFTSMQAQTEQDSVVKPKKVFYDAKNSRIGISGDTALVMSPAFDNKYFYNGIDQAVLDTIKGIDGETLARRLNEAGVGKMVLDFLFQYNGQGLSEDMLRDRAFANAQTADEELAAAGLIDKETLLRDDLLPILEHNYIVLKRGFSPEKWYVFRVGINQEIWDQVYNCWNDMERYNQIEVPVEYVKDGKHKLQIGEFNPNLRQISRKVPAMAIRGQIIAHHPLRIGLGTSSGLKNRDRMYIYRTTTDKDGNLVSKKIGTARIGKVHADTAWIYSQSGGYASRKRGDIAVFMPDKKNGHSLTVNMMDGSYGLAYTYDHMVFNNRHGFAGYVMAQVGASVYGDTWNDKLYNYNCEITGNAESLRSPIIVDGGLGFGVGWTFLHRLEIVPFFMAQYEGLYFHQKKTEEEKEIAESRDEVDLHMAHSIRVPVGVKVNLNIWYPLQLTVGATYDFVACKFKGQLSKLAEEENAAPTPASFNYKDAEEIYLDPMGRSRTGLNVFAGLRWCF